MLGAEDDEDELEHYNERVHLRIENCFTLDANSCRAPLVLRDIVLSHKQRESMEYDARLKRFVL